MAIRTAIGDSLYLHRAKAGPITPGHHLLISAHGVFVQELAFFGRPLSTRVPAWCQLHFYAPHGDSILDPTVPAILSGSYQVFETIRPGSPVVDYRLSKYQGRHGSVNETYESITENLRANEAVLDTIQQQAAKGRAIKFGPNFAFHFDVLTIRNRWWMKASVGEKLSDVLQALATAGYRYENIHCSFCRSPMIGGGTSSATRFGQG
ncbi:MAG: hypothetical protein KC613_04705 [Myxococcales bacterium]|nr:hypothetical protein [Myxococcales bacterium]MCB9524759.1 hypothetical protein [Myxococcales bacterium]